MSLIDPTVVKILVETQLGTVNSTTIPKVYYPGDGVDNMRDRWIKIRPIDHQSLPNDREDSTDVTGLDCDGIVVTVNCFASQRAMKTSAAALSSVMAEVRRVLFRKCLRDVATTHQVDLTECKTVTDDEDEQRRMATGAVIVTGIVTRTVGATVTPLV